MPKYIILLVVTVIGAIGCESTSVETDISVDGVLTGSSAGTTVSMNHGSNLGDSPSLVLAPASLILGTTEKLDLILTRTGVATATGYELMAVVNNFSVSGGGGIFTGSATAGNSALFAANTGSIAKTSYYYFEDSGETATFSLPDNSGFATRLMLGRVKIQNGDIARIPFTETGAVTANFLGVGCLTDGDDPCFDVATLITTLFTALSGAVTASVNADSNLTLGGSEADGDFRIDYLPSAVALRGCGNSPSQDPAFGFIFAATVDAPLGIKVRIRIPMMFSLLESGNEIEARVHPFGDLGGCQETQFIDAITVHTTTFLGIGAQAIADLVQTNIVCSLFGPDVGEFDCTDITPAPLSTLLTSGLAAMVGNTATYYWRQTHGNSPVPGQFGVMMRPRNADNSITTTNVTPGAPGAVAIDLVFTQ